MSLVALLGLLALTQQQTISVDGEPVRISRDAYGVPHIYANSTRGLYYGAGYAIAQDRLWQMERNRRAATGELAEIYGKDAVASDTSARTDGYTQDELNGQFKKMGKEQQTATQAYADGVNGWIADAGDKTPKEFEQFGISPHQWGPTDCIALAAMMSRRFGAFGEGELRNYTAYTYLQTKLKDKAIDAIDDAAWINDPESPTTIPPEEGGPKPPTGPSRAITEAHLKLLPKIGLLELMAAVDDFAMVPQIEFAMGHGLYTRFGSYALAVDKAHSSTGHALLLGAPQMGWSTPQIAHEIHISGAGVDVIGMGFPGIPGVLIGHNEWLAWTTTSGLGDGADVFLEKIDPTDPEKYVYRGDSLPFETRKETILVRGGAPVEITVRRTVHGPVIKSIGKKWAFARKSAYWDREVESFQAFMDFARAKTLKDFEKACAKVVGSHNFLAATQDGQIGYWYTGLYPIRSPKLDPRLPVPGTGEYEWTGIVPFSNLPKCINPKRGWMGNWNNKPAAWYLNSDTPVWGAVFRYKRIEDLFKAKKLISPDEIRRMVSDIATYQSDADFFTTPLFFAAKGRNLPPSEAQALRILSAWDNREMDGSAAAAIFQAYMRELRKEALMPVLGNFGSDVSFFQIAQPSYLWHVLGKSSAKLNLDYLQGRTKEEVMLAAFSKAVAGIVKTLGPDVSDVSYKAGRMNLAPIPDVPYTNRGTYIMIVELENPALRAESVLCPGQSEDPLSPHYSDQRDLASWWSYKPLKREGPGPSSPPK